MGLTIWYQILLMIIGFSIICILERYGINHKICNWISLKIYKTKKGKITIKEAIQLLVKTRSNSELITWQMCDFKTEEEFYTSMLFGYRFPFYGDKMILSDNISEQEEIPENMIPNYGDPKRWESDYSILYSSSGEPIYKNISIKYEDLNVLIKIK